MATAVVIGATGGIGKALVEDLVRRGEHGEIHALSRRPGPASGAGVLTGHLDLTCLLYTSPSPRDS